MKEKLAEHIKKNYEPKHGKPNSSYSQGNCDDVFSDGFNRGYAIALSECAEIMGVEVPPLEPQDTEY